MTEIARCQLNGVLCHFLEQSCTFHVGLPLQVHPGQVLEPDGFDGPVELAAFRSGTDGLVLGEVLNSVDLPVFRFAFQDPYLVSHVVSHLHLHDTSLDRGHHARCFYVEGRGKFPFFYPNPYGSGFYFHRGLKCLFVLNDVAESAHREGFDDDRSPVFNTQNQSRFKSRGNFGLGRQYHTDLGILPAIPVFLFVFLLAVVLFVLIVFLRKPNFTGSLHVRDLDFGILTEKKGGEADKEQNGNKKTKTLCHIKFPG